MAIAFLKNTRTVLERVLGDTDEITAVLTDNASPPAVVNLTGYESPKLRAVGEDGNVLFEGDAEVVSAVAGTIKYEPVAGDFDTIGRFALYWILTETATSLPRRWPYDGPKWIVDVVDEAPGDL